MRILVPNRRSVIAKKIVRCLPRTITRSHMGSMSLISIRSCSIGFSEQGIGWDQSSSIAIAIPNDPSYKPDRFLAIRRLAGWHSEQIVLALTIPLR